MKISDTQLAITTKKQPDLQRTRPLQITKKAVANINQQRHLQRTQSVRKQSFQILFATDYPLQFLPLQNTYFATAQPLQLQRSELLQLQRDSRCNCNGTAGLPVAMQRRLLKRSRLQLQRGRPLQLQRQESADGMQILILGIDFHKYY